MDNSRQRYGIIDALRGFCIILMVIYHFFFDLTMFGLFPYNIMFSKWINVLQIFFAALFVAMSGASSVFSSNLYKRSFKLLICAAVVTAATYVFDSTGFVVFGILHLLGTASFLCALFKKLMLKINVNPIIWIILFVISHVALNRIFDIPHLWIFGICDKNFVSTDYFPLLPWIFAYFAGISFGKAVVQKKLPAAFYEFKLPALEWVGRHTLSVYLLHQPVIMAIIFLILKIIRMGGF